MRAVVTGATSGIGYATSRKLSSLGYKVLAVGRNEAVGRRLVDEGMDFYRADLSRADDVDSLADYVISEFGKPDVLVNNAGVLLLKPLEEFSLDEFEYVYRVNLYAPLLLMKRLMPYMAENGGGVVINISSIAGTHPYPNGAAYCSSKSALIALSKVAALEYASRNVRVVVVAPGLVKTRMAIEGLGGEDRLEKAASRIPVGYVAEPEEIAELIAYLASDKARYITGSVFVIDGGVTAGRTSSLVEERQ